MQRFLLKRVRHQLLPQKYPTDTGDFYTLSCQDWSVGPWADSEQIIHATETTDEYVFKTFEEGKKYNYSVFIDLTSEATKKNCKFDENTKLF